MTGRGEEQPDAIQDRDRYARVKVSDKRRISDSGKAGGDASSDAATGEATEEATKSAEAAEAEVLRGQVEALTNDLMRLQAEFDNYRKRMMRDQTDVAQQTVATFVKKLLPVLDNFDRALEHGAEDSVVLLHKELLGVLAAEGIEEIPAQGARFDPHLHEAVESNEDEEAREPIVRAVYRTGYRFGPKVLRHSMVGVARPAEGDSQKTEEAASHSDVAAGESQGG